jgi:hypothetical protein
MMRAPNHRWTSGGVSLGSQTSTCSSRGLKWHGTFHSPTLRQGLADIARNVIGTHFDPSSLD